MEAEIWHPEELVPHPQGYISIPMHRIRLTDKTIRKSFVTGPLVRSIGRVGMLQPLCVRPLDPKWKEFEPIIGCRRYMACKRLGVERVPCYIRPNVSLADIARIALEENRCRKELTHGELYRSIRLLREEGRPINKISLIARIPPAQVIAYLKLNNTPDEVKKAFFGKKIGITQLMLLQGVDSNERMLDYLRRTIKKKLTTTALSEFIKWDRWKGNPPPQANPDPQPTHVGRSAVKRVRELFAPTPSRSLLDKQTRKLFGRHLFLSEGYRGASFEIRAKSKGDILRIFRFLSKSIALLCSISWTKRRKLTREERLARAKESQRKWYQANRERVLAMKRRYREGGKK